MGTDARLRSKFWMAVGLLVASAFVAWLVADKSTSPPRPVQPVPAASSPKQGSRPTAFTAIADAAPAKYELDEPLVISRRWGSDDDSLGRTRPAEGNPEAPMSFAVAADGSLTVLDQVNARLVRIARNGRTIAKSQVTERAPQDVALGPHGETAVLDRVGDQTVTIRSPSGNVVGKLPLRGPGVPEPGQISGVFIDQKNVYVERRHGPLVFLGDLDGKVAPERSEIPGRPTRDGTLFVSAGIVDRQAGRMFVSAIDRKLGEHRFTREIRTQAPLLSIVLLDSDRRGTIYAGVALEAEQRDWHRVYCMEPQHGGPLGEFEVGVTPMPEETLRDMAVMDDGGVIVAERSDQGVRYAEHRCQ